ncbi:Protein TYR-6 [Aphelenchoides avenae]|nr:Protein TYR-6 [Aphelenchus avenae]
MSTVDFWYEYQFVRQCTPERPFCDSKYYWCNEREWRCMSKVALGGNCTGYVGTDICHNSVCIMSTCRIPATAGNGFVRKEKKPTSGVVWAKTLMLTDGDQPLTSGIAHITVRDEVTNDNTTVYIQKQTQYPEYPGLVYLPLPHPRETFYYNVTLEAQDHYGRYCQSYCYNATAEKYQVCQPRLALNARNDAKASNISYTHAMNSRRFLDMDMSVHPSLWKVYPPYMIFACHRKVVQTQAVNDIAGLMSTPMERTEYVWFRVNVLRRADSPIDVDDSEVEVEDLDDPSDVWISSIRRARSAYDQSVVLVRARNPRVFHRGVSVRISIRNGSQRLPCDSRCNLGPGRDEPCVPTVFLHEKPHESQEQIFTSDPAYLQFLGWKMIGHPAEWQLKMAYLSFYC